MLPNLETLEEIMRWHQLESEVTAFKMRLRERKYRNLAGGSLFRRPIQSYHDAVKILVQPKASSKSGELQAKAK